MPRTTPLARARRLVDTAVDRALATRRLVVAAGLLGLVVVGSGALRLRTGEPLPPTTFDPLRTDLAIEAPTTGSAGQQFDVIVTGKHLADGASIALLVDTGYEVRHLSAPASGGTAAFTVDPWEGPASGVLRLTAVSARSVATASIDYRPSSAVDPIEVYLGPRTIDALDDEISATMAVVVPEDRFGNPVADGTPVEIATTRPDGEQISSTMYTERLLAWRRIVSGTVAGRSKVGISVGDAHSDELDFLEVAGTPEPFELVPIDPPAPADGRSLVRIRTTELADQFGNVLPDGIIVFADLDGPGGVRRLHRQIIGGTAEFTIEAPATPGTETIVVSASGTVSAPFDLEFAPMVSTFDVATFEDHDGIRIRVGPVISTLGAYVPDGTPVSAMVDNNVVERLTSDGIAEIVIAHTADPITVTILGAEQTHRHES